ncbi:MAG: glycine oxidase ThiO [Candidatus Rokubacteria bacterium 13_1_40CM_69_27]|nr:MAG: glycine oxidase ThiO [Candidatus Rokubacteria bacterium 13_1_40CM_69_27]OLC32935.1 MAG: glycine oxidase ThiO [Candidatus Rokubacteria bacterium 13_1_40CM_4_69_5]OLE36768.1 MAG: glycine oxidase ThiO [Candidatus Rokubacteria bacterium 13_1_20CM_2_70_7]
MKVVVVGGGVIGCATAYELAKAGCAVVLLERATPGAEASGAAAGMLAPLGESSAAGFRELAVASWRLYPAVVHELRERTGIDVEYVTRGTIYALATVHDVREAQSRAQWALGREFGIEAWDSGEVHAREPALSAKVSGAMFVRGDHWVNNQRLVVAYAQAAVAAGVALITGCGVSRLIVEDGHARAVVVADGERLDADVIVLAAGAWTAPLVASFGERLPVEPRRGQMIALAHVPPVLTHCVHGDEVYLVPRPSGELLVGATVERVGFQGAVTALGIAGLLSAAIELVPVLGGLPINRTWYGFRPWAPDNLPILGPWPGLEGLWIATAHFRNGILLAPITAKVMTEWILTGRPSLSLEDFLPDRFIMRREP